MTETCEPTRHLLIGGTGRAGTSFLVRYLAALGLDTYLARHGEAGWDEEANAGLENLSLPSQVENDLPYVLKSPWLYEQIDYILTHDLFRIDGVIVPIRPLAEATASRAVLEHQAMHRSMPCQAEFDVSWETWGTTPGGMVYSLNPLDEGRLLAVGLHVLLERLVSADIPVVLLAFPRLANDADYLFRKLRPFLPAVAAETARSAHLKVADPAKVRMGKEIAQSALPMRLMKHEAPEQIDLIAIRRELTRTRKALTAGEAEIAELRAALTAGEAEIAELRAALTAGEAEIAELRAALTAREAEIAELRATLTAGEAEIAELRATLTAGEAEIAELRATLTAGEAEIAELRATLTALTVTVSRLQDDLDGVLTSRSWRLTRPYRILGMGLRRLVTGFRE